MAVDLDRQIAIEQERAGISDVNHYAYPTFAKAAIQRRNNLSTSAANLAAKLAAARGELDEACEELKKIELIEERDAERLRLEQARTASAELEDLAVHRVAS
jgi:flagellar export protein FliJ